MSNLRSNSGFTDLYHASLICLKHCILSSTTLPYFLKLMFFVLSMHKTPEKMFRKDVQNENIARMEALNKVSERDQHS